MCGDHNFSSGRRQINAIVEIDVARLNRPLRPFFARQLHSFVAEIRGIPTDCDRVVCRVFRKGEGNGFFDIPVTVAPDGAYAYIIGTCFQDVGTSKYEIHAFDADGNSTALGVGEILTLPFSASGDPLEVGEERPVMTIQDRNGGTHTITAIWDGENWTSIIDDDWAVGRGSAEMSTITSKDSSEHSITATGDGAGSFTSVSGENENA